MVSRDGSYTFQWQRAPAGRYRMILFARKVFRLLGKLLYNIAN